MTKLYMGDINIENGGTWYELPDSDNWQQDYCTALSVTDCAHMINDVQADSLWLIESGSIYMPWGSDNMANILNTIGATLQQIWADCDKQALQTLATERLTERSGFIPFYSADIADWGDDPLEWESPLQSLLVESWCNEWEDSEWRDSPWGAMETYACNGCFETWIEESTK